MRALTTLNAVGPLGVLTLAGGFLFARVGLVARVYAGRTFPALRFIHFASWSLVRNLPAADPDKRVRLSTPYLLFVTNFNGSFDQYIDAFSYTVGWRISNIWRFSYGFPGPRPSEAFKAYIERQEVPSLHYYAAYPHASASVVISALRVRERMRRLEHETRGASPEEFAVRYRRFLTDVQEDL